MFEQPTAIALVIVLLLSGLTEPASAQTEALPRPGEVFKVGERTAFVIEPPAPARRAGPLPWIWYAPTLKKLPGGEEAWMFDRFLAAGIAIAGIDVGESYGNPKGRASYQALYELLTTQRGYARKPVLLARSRGGLMLYNWAVEHPRLVGGIAGIYPVCNLASWPGVSRAAPAFEMTSDELDAKLDEHNPIDRLAPLAKARVPILHLHGDQDGTVPLSANSAELGRRYAAMGGPVEISVIEGRGHDMWSGWFQSQRLTDFAIAHALAGQTSPGIETAIDTTKPVKVYILAGQSNMLEMGTVDAGNTRHAGFFLSAEPDAARRLMVSVYPGAYSPDVDYDEEHPAATGAVEMGGDAEFPTIPGAHTDVARGFLEVARSGKYSFRPGYQRSTYNVMELDGREVYRRNRGEAEAARALVELHAGVRYAVEITYFEDGWAPFWIRREEVPGTLRTLTAQGKFSHLIDDRGNWTTREDVYYYEARINFQGGPLAVGKRLGPELQFGHVMGDAHDEQVLLIKTAMGNRALAWDFRPPSSGELPERPGDAKWEGLEYRLMVDGVRKTLDDLGNVLPGYAGQGYEIAGFTWFQGHKDAGREEWTEEYERNLVNLIQDVRAEFQVPRLPVVIATVGFGGQDMQDDYLRIHAAQMAVSGATGKYPAFAGNVLTVDTRDFWRSSEESPQNQGYHYHRNAETFLLVGDALGKGMVALQRQAR